MKSLAEIRAHPGIDIIDSGPDGFACTLKQPTWKLRIVASWGMGWDHVSVSHAHRTPRYQEMKAVKRIFFRSDEWAVEYHPPSKDYISIHDNVLHMWRPQDVELPVPPSIMV